MILKDKVVIIINGKGGAGKDTLCDIAGDTYGVRTVSSITPVKEIAALCGWHGEKDAKARRFLAELKQALLAYNDLPNTYLAGEYRSFMDGDADILFVHIREPDQIAAFKRSVPSKCVSLLVRSPAAACPYGNDADDRVEDYSYDYYYDNVQPLDAAAPDFTAFLNSLLTKEGVL